VDQLHRSVSLLPRDLKFVLHAQTRFFHLWHSIFQIDDLDRRWLSRHGF
jgi:hypothetical protein